MTTYTVTGTTRNSRGGILPSVVVSLFTTSTEALISTTTADTNGSFAFTSLASNGPVFMVGYLSGTPDVAGTTLNNIVPTAESSSTPATGNQHWYFLGF